MIATMPAGATGSGLAASRTVISKVVDRFPVVLKPTVGGLNIDGGVGLSVVRRASLPVILLPLFAECGDAIQGIVDAVFTLQQASLDFRIVVATDMSSFKQLRPYGWAISHVQAEEGWSENYWLEYAECELDRITEAFGCSYVIETSENGISSKSWENLLSISGFGEALPNSSRRTDVPGRFLHGSWRGWLGNIPDGNSGHRIISGDREWNLDISKNPKSSMVLLRIESDLPGFSATLPSEVGSHWNVVSLRTADHEVPQAAELVLAVSAVFDALSLNNCGILEGQFVSETVLDPMFPSITWTREISQTDVERAYRRALSSWSCIA
jgi:hypothetical protein